MADYSVFVVDENASLDAAQAAIHEAGGHIALVLPPRVLLGRFTGDAQKLVGRAGIAFASQQEAGTEAFALAGKEAIPALGFYNGVKSGRLAAAKQKALELPPLPFDGKDALARPDMPREGRMKLGADGMKVATDAQTYWMRGKNVVSLFFVDSKPESGPYSWSWGEVTNVYNQALSALNWWVDEFIANGVSAPALTFVVEAHYPFYLGAACSPDGCFGWVNHSDNTNVSIYSEPVTLNRLTFEQNSIGNVMANFGYTTGTIHARVHGYNDSRAIANAAEGAFSVFIPVFPTNATWTDGGWAFAYFGGPYVINPSIQNFYQIYQFERVFAHETGHIYWACDEYFASGCDCMRCHFDGPRNVVNGNCVTCGASNDQCVMRDNGPHICDYTKTMIGW
jgi:hypothetical protein